MSPKAISRISDALSKMRKTPRQVEMACEETTLKNMIYTVHLYLANTVPGQS